MRIPGAYRPGKGWLHASDPRAKIIAIVLFLVGAALASGLPSILLLLGATGLLWAGAGCSWHAATSTLRPLMPLLCFVFLVNGLASMAGAAPHEAVGAMVVAAAGESLLVTAKLACAVVGAATLTMTTDPERLTAALRALARPLCRNGRRLDEYAFTVSAAFRFVPLLADEALRVKRAQESRGARFEGGGLIARVRAWVPVFTPLFAQGLCRADRLAYAVASRGFFGPQRHTSLVQFRWLAGDSALCTAAVLFVAVSAIAG